MYLIQELTIGSPNKINDLSEPSSLSKVYSGLLLLQSYTGPENSEVSPNLNLEGQVIACEVLALLGGLLTRSEGYAGGQWGCQGYIDSDGDFQGFGVLSTFPKDPFSLFN